VENRRKKKEEVVERTSVCIWGLELTSIRSLLDEELPRPNRLSPPELPSDLPLLVCWLRENGKISSRTRAWLQQRKTGLDTVNSGQRNLCPTMPTYPPNQDSSNPSKCSQQLPRSCRPFPCEFVKDKLGWSAGGGAMQLEQKFRCCQRRLGWIKEWHEWERKAPFFLKARSKRLNL
jgi:hypothetical protein